MEKIKIAHIQLLPLLSGAQNVMLSILNSLDKDKYDIYVISKPGGPLVERVLELGYNYIPLSSFKRSISIMDIVALIELIKIFKKYKFDIVHTHSSKPGFIGRIAARIVGVPKIVHTVHGFPFHPYQKKLIKKFYQSMEKFAALFCDKVVFVNNSEREAAIVDHLIQPRKAITIYNGIELPKIEIQTKRKSDKFIIGSCLRFWKQKNIIDTINAAICVCKQNKDIQFIFIGDGELYKVVEKMVYDSGFEDRIQLPGWQKNSAEWLQKFDVFLLYSKWEGLPLSILEAMSYGLPIVASDIKGNNELVSDVNGILVPINDIDRLTAILLSLPNDKNSVKEWGANSRKLIKEKFNIMEFIRKYKNVYDQEYN
jgi:glycosyltransferase involved in cell wall biosynthesis